MDRRKPYKRRTKSTQKKNEEYINKSLIIRAFISGCLVLFSVVIGNVKAFSKTRDMVKAVLNENISYETVKSLTETSLENIINVKDNTFNELFEDTGVNENNENIPIENEASEEADEVTEIKILPPETLLPENTK